MSPVTFPPIVPPLPPNPLDDGIILGNKFTPRGDIALSYSATGPFKYASNDASFTNQIDQIAANLMKYDDLKIAFTVGGGHKGNYIFAEKWSDRLYDGVAKTYNDQFGAFRSFIEGLFDKRGIKSDRISVSKGNIIEKKYSAQYDKI
ncbi:MAG: hypothetical protein ACJATI_003260 [Halioglobus sp.]|jgi:hypothetical protein